MVSGGFWNSIFNLGSLNGAETYIVEILYAYHGYSS